MILSTHDSILYIVRDVTISQITIHARLGFSRYTLHTNEISFGLNKTSTTKFRFVKFRSSGQKKIVGSNNTTFGIPALNREQFMKEILEN